MELRGFNGNNDTTILYEGKDYGWANPINGQGCKLHPFPECKFCFHWDLFQGLKYFYGYEGARPEYMKNLG